MAGKEAKDKEKEVKPKEEKKEKEKDVETWVRELRKEMNQQKTNMDRAFNEHVREMKRQMDSMQQELADKDTVITILRGQVLKLQQEAHAQHEDTNTKLEALQKEVEDIKKTTPEEGEIPLTDVKEELTRDMEVKLKGWADIVKKEVNEEWNVVKSKRKEAKASAPPAPPPIQESELINATIIEERMRRARRCNVRITGIPERDDISPEEDAKEICKKVGYPEEETPPYIGAWRAGLDRTRARALLLRFADETQKIAFIKKRSLLKDIEGDPIYFDDDLTKQQVKHRKDNMPRVKAARSEGKKAFYRDGQVYIDGKVAPPQ